MPEPARVGAKDLEKACRERATAALVARHLPDGGRHDFAMALAGFLLRPGRLDKEQALGIMEAAWDAAGYPNGKSRAEAMRDLEGILGDTGVRLGEGKRVWGGPTLGEMSPGLPGALEKFWGWKEARPPATKPNTVSAADLLIQEFTPINWVVPGILPEGVTILAGKPKIGKSWLMLDLCLGVAHRGVVLGTKEVEQGPCLYLALEDNPRRLQRRLRKLTESGLGTHGPPEGFDIATEWPRVGEGCEEALRDWLNRNPGARAIVVDTLAKVRPRQKGQNVYAEDYGALEPLLPVAAEYGVAIVVVHHLRKTPSEDWMDEISSFTGLTGGVDGALAIKRERGSHEATLHVSGRDVEEEAELALRWTPELARWVLVGDAEEHRRSEARKAILEELARADEPVSPKDLALALDKKDSAVRKLLHSMKADGEVVQTGTSPSTRYALPPDHGSGGSGGNGGGAGREESFPFPEPGDPGGAA